MRAGYSMKVLLVNVGDVELFIGHAIAMSWLKLYTSSPDQLLRYRETMRLPYTVDVCSSCPLAQEFGHKHLPG